ncbi:ATPase, T2SS/T4P/T4SS family, partial [Klebsiella pneumoniae]|uniref:ATPase, T2SS/T4P/T4SS family n=1 Tax=Klebsiella pneumoniae TaxID=573 RepID=UPI001C129CD4
IITAAKLVKSCLRMKPDRILLAEIKGGDAWDFVKVAGSGHSGSMTSIHAASAKDAIIQMVTKCYQNRECQNLPFDVLRKIIMDSIDIVVHVGRDGVVRHMSDIYYKGAECENF